MKNSSKKTYPKRLCLPDRIKVLIYSNKTKAAEASAKYIVKIINKKPNAVISYATGNTMLPVFESLQKLCKKGDADFKKSSAFHLDEYYPCSVNENFSFVKFLNENLFKYLNIPKKHIFTLEGSAKDAKKEAERYEYLLSARKIDLAILGIGPGGHLAFNESGSSFKSRTRLVDLSEETLKRDHIERGQDSPSQALTQGIANILEAKRILLVAYGAEKGKLLKKALFEPVSESCPASALRLVGKKVTIIIDQEAYRQIAGLF